MNEKLPLFEPRKKYRNHDPETARIAAERAGSLAASDQRRILDYLDAIHPRSATYRDIAAGTGLERHAIGRRLKELKIAGLIEEAGTTLMESGRPGALWRIKQ